MRQPERAAGSGTNAGGHCHAIGNKRDFPAPETQCAGFFRLAGRNCDARSAHGAQQTFQVDVTTAQRLWVTQMNAVKCMYAPCPGQQGRRSAVDARAFAVGMNNLNPLPARPARQAGKSRRRKPPLRELKKALRTYSFSKTGPIGITARRGDKAFHFPRQMARQLPKMLRAAPRQGRSSDLQNSHIPAFFRGMRQCSSSLFPGASLRLDNQKAFYNHKKYALCC